MSESLVKHFRQLIETLDVPGDDLITDEALARYEAGRDILLMYRGDPDILMRALRTFISTQARPLIYAGAACVVISASYISGGKFETEGIDYARSLHGRAASYSRDSFQIELLDVTLLRHLKQMDKMRSALDSIRDHYANAQTSIGYIFAEMDYWDQRANITEFEKWANIGLEHAQNNVHRLNVLNRLAGTYLKMPKFVGSKQALAYYQKIVTLDPEDPWAWHNMSIIHQHESDYEQAAFCNYRALELMPFGNAFDMLRALVERFAKQRHKDPIQEVARYNVATNKSGRH
jgi:tetratricopeptide (TPR) repeat protein